jgi:hypothetical protein
MWRAKRDRYLSGVGGEMELTPRGKHKVLHLGAITHRGPPQRTPRGLDVRAYQGAPVVIRCYIGLRPCVYNTIGSFSVTY